jgi:FKBP-type peptidyl-prolyl cis-trans isomerase FkpA
MPYFSAKIVLMKRVFYLVLGIACFGILLFFACGKASPGYYNCTDQDPSTDSSALLAFAKSNGITPLSDTIGLYYQIVTQGSGASPTLTSNISVLYKASLLDGTVFDSTSGTTTRSFVLNTLVPAWQIALPRLQTGGRIKLLVPSKYGYGCVGANTSVPPNTPIYFDITLVSFQ